VGHDDAAAPEAGGRSSPRLDASGLLATGALFYALGVVVENLYLWQFGSADFTLLRPRAAFTGLLVALPTVVSLWVPLFLFERPKDVQPGGRWFVQIYRRFNQAGDWFGVVVLQLAPLIYYWAAVLLIPGRTVPRTPESWVFDIFLPGLFLWFTGLVASLLGFFVLLAATGNEERMLDELGQVNRDRTPRTIRNTASLLFGLLLMGAAHLVLFVAWVYPSVPRQIGGARPQDVQLVVSGDDFGALSSLGVPWVSGVAASGSSSRLTEKLLLIEAGEG
jgi:hypothetical protein